MAANKSLPVCHHSAVYIFWFYTIIELNPGKVQIHMRVTDAVLLAEMTKSEPVNMTLSLFSVMECLHCSQGSFLLEYTHIPEVRLARVFVVRLCHHEDISI